MSTSGHNSCPQPKSPPIIAWSVIVSLIIRHCLSLSISHIGCWQTHSCSIAKILVVNKTEVGYVKKPQVWCYDEVWASHGEAAWGLHAHAVLAHCAGTNLSWFSAFNFMKNVKHVFDTEFIQVYECKKLSNRPWFDKVIAKKVQFFWLTWYKWHFVNSPISMNDRKRNLKLKLH